MDAVAADETGSNTGKAGAQRDIVRNSPKGAGFDSRGRFSPGYRIANIRTSPNAARFHSALQPIQASQAIFPSGFQKK
jgi:hypothetical protein